MSYGHMQLPPKIGNVKWPETNQVSFNRQHLSLHCKYDQALIWILINYVIDLECLMYVLWSYAITPKNRQNENS